MARNKYDEIAIIGVGCELPAGISNPDALWDFLEKRGDASVEVPEDRWSTAHFYDSVEQTPGKTTMRRGHFLRWEAYHFEPLFFGISPREGMTMDFQQRLLLGVTWHALEDARLIPSDFNGHKVGVFIGGFTQDHMVYCGSPFMRTQIRDQFAATAASMTMLAARLAHVYGFQGPTMALDTACSSSLVALHQACNSLRLGECDMALAGGANFMSSPQTAMLMTKGHFLAKDGRSKTFDASADGYGRGEGCVVLTLKRLDDALRDGNDIRAVISGSGVNQDGRTPVLTMPDAGAQESLMEDVLRRADVKPSNIAYVEAHGTGTPVGDPIEAKAISQAVARHRPDGHNVVVGAVKANLGHTEATAGALSVLKATLCLEKGVVPGQANLENLNPAIPFEEYRLTIPQYHPVRISSEDKPLYALINAFGYGGTNAVALLRKPTEKERAVAEKKALRDGRLKGVKPLGWMRRTPLVLSAFSERSLRAIGQEYGEYCTDITSEKWDSVCASSIRYRARFRHRAVIVPRRGEEFERDIKAALGALSAGKKHPSLYEGTAVVDENTAPVFLFSGMGPQWWGMGRFLLKKGPRSVRHLAEQCDYLFSELSGWSLREELLKPEEKSRIQETYVAQPAIFLVQICLVEFFAEHGVRPSAVIGHSVGEVAAAYVSGALSLEAAVRVIYHRSRLQALLSGQGGMLAIGLSEDVLKERLLDFDGKVSIAAVNAAKSCTLAGEHDALEKIAEECEREGVFSRFLKVEVPYHSPAMDAIEQDMKVALEGITTHQPHIELYSTVTGKEWNVEEKHDGAYWFRNARSPVLFYSAIRKLLDAGKTIFLEMAAHPVLAASINEIAVETRHDVSVIPTLRRKHHEEDTLIKALATLVLSGSEPDWRYIVRPGVVRLPLYSWRVDEKPWLETEAAKRDRLNMTVHPILGTPSILSEQSWRGNMTSAMMPWLSDHRVDGVTIFPAAAYIEAALAAHEQMESKAPAVLENILLETPLVLQEGMSPVMMWNFDDTTYQLSFTSETLAWNGDWQKHGHVSIVQAAPWAKGTLQLDALYEGTSRFSGDDVYAALRENGLDYGPSFRTLKALYRGEGFALGEVALNDSEASHVEEYFIHPALLDGAMHTMIGAFPLEEVEGVFVPTEIRRLSYMGIKTSRLLVHVVPTLKMAHKVEADLQLYTPEGVFVGEVLGLCCRRMGRSGQDAASKVGRLLYAPSWVSTERQMLMSEPRSITVLGAVNGIAQELIQTLQETGSEVTVCHDLSGASLGEKLVNEKFLAEQSSFVFVCPVGDDFSVGQKTLLEAVTFINRLPVRTRKRRVPILVITQGGYEEGGTASIQQRSMFGFFRGVQTERIDLAIRCVDVPCSLDEQLIEDVAAEVTLEEVAEDSVILRSDQRLVQRIIVPALDPEPDPVPFVKLEGSQDGRLGINLTPSKSGVLEGMTWQAYDIGEPGPRQIKVRTVATSLNFKDMLKVMSLLPEVVTEGTYNGDTLGMEAVVEVVSVGSEVTQLSQGDLCLLIYPDCFSSYKILDIDVLDTCMLSLTEVIREYGADALAGVPLVFVTAYYGLSYLARLQEGEKVLIHAGAGGVGQAAIQIALMKGATVYATAGSQEKRDYLLRQGCAGVWDSRTLEFVDGIRSATEGYGVDVVLNSLPGEALTHSLSLVAPMGRFVEIGKRDIIEHRRLDLIQFNDNLSFFSFDMDRMMPHPRLYQMLEEILKLARTGKLTLLPYTSFKASDVVEAFRFLASSRHIGKVILSFDDMDGVQARPPQRPLPVIQRLGSYIITGGMGGFGLKTAEYLLKKGAGAIHLVGRRKPTDPDRKGVLDKLMTFAEGLDSEVIVHQLDVTDKRAVKELVLRLSRDDKPLRGIYHAAGVVDDVMVSGLTEESVASVMSAKVLGAQALDDATRQINLDYFVLYSSFTVEIGNVGQSVYMAANASLNAIAENRRSLGLPALAVGWGAMGNIGMLARSEAANRMFDAAGVKTMDAGEALELLPTLHRLERSVVSLVDIHWGKAFGALNWLESAGRFASLQKETQKDGVSDTLQVLFSIPESERLGYVLNRLKQQLGSVLQIDPETIGDGARLSELGIDSLAGVELQMAIRSEFGVDVSLVLLARNETIIEMSRALLRQAVSLQRDQATLDSADVQ